MLGMVMDIMDMGTVMDMAMAIIMELIELINMVTVMVFSPDWVMAMGAATTDIMATMEVIMEDITMVEIICSNQFQLFPRPVQ